MLTTGHKHISFASSTMVLFSCLIAFSLLIHVSSAGCAKGDIANDPFGQMVYRPDTDPVSNGGTVTVQCTKAGYQSIGGTARTLKCIDYKWEGTIRTCQPAKCPKKFLNCIRLENGNFTYEGNSTEEEVLENGTLAHVVCNKGYQLVKKRSDGQYREVENSDEDALQFCNRGVWDGKTPSVLGYKCIPMGKVLIIGGFYADGITMELYDIEHPEVNEILSLQLDKKRHGHVTGISDNGIVVIAGGLKDAAYTMDTEFYNPKENQIVSGPPLDRRRGYAASVMLNNEMIVCGGFDDIDEIALDTCKKLSHDEITAEYQWSTFPSLLQTRYAHAMARLDDDLFVIGGFSPLRNTTTNTAERYDHEDKIWISIDPISSYRTHPAAAQLNGFIYVCGGYVHLNPTSTPGVLKDICQIYDPVSESWSEEMAHMHTKTASFSMIVVDGTLYAFTHLGVVEYHDPATNTWNITEPIKKNRGTYLTAVQLKAT